MKDLHPDSSKSFDEKANYLIGELSKILSPARSDRYKDRIPDAMIGSDNILGIIGWEVDQEEQIKSMSGEVGGEIIGLQDDSYKKFARLCEQICRTTPFKGSVSESFVRRNLFEWMLGNFPEMTVAPTATQYLLDQAAASISQIEIWVPIDDLIMRVPLQLGGVRLFMCSESDIDAIISAARSDTHALTDDVISQIKLDWVGRSVGAVVIEAEAEYAAEVAWQKVKAVCCSINIYFPASLLPRITSSLAPRGYRSIPAQRVMTIIDQELVSAASRMMRLPNDWEITSDVVTSMRSEFLDDLDEILTEPKTNFEKTLVSVFQAYGSALYEEELANKLTMITSALEALFLKDRNEPVTQNVADRLAISVVRDADARMNVVKIFKATYDLRSRAVHHGLRLDDREKLREFFMWARFAVLSGLRARKCFAKKADFISALDREKYS